MESPHFCPFLPKTLRISEVIDHLYASHIRLDETHAVSIEQMTGATVRDSTMHRRQTQKE